MPYYTSRSRRPIHEVKHGHHHSRLLSNWLDSSYIAADGTTGQKYVYPGLVVAVDSSTNKYVPYSAGASYGTGSNTAVGVMDEFLDVTFGDEAITPIWHGGLIEAYCYVYGSAAGTIAAGIKTSLDDIVWV